jgi:hypothetical protein
MILPLLENQNDSAKCLILLGARGQKLEKTGFGVELGGAASRHKRLPQRPSVLQNFKPLALIRKTDLARAKKNLQVRIFAAQVGPVVRGRRA